MDFTLISRFFLNNWQRKLLALVGAFVIWLFVNNSITDTKTIPNVPIRITNLPPDKTVVGLLPNRLLSKRVTLTLSGTKDVIQELESGDLEVLLDVSSAESDEWVVQIAKKNLVSLNPSIDLLHHITDVEHPKFVLKLSPLVIAKLPIRISHVGEPPNGYEFLDIWPERLVQTVSGSEEEIQNLKEKGLELILNLSDISKSDLDVLHSSVDGAAHEDEIGYSVPKKWKKVVIHNIIEDIDDPEVENLRIDFLRKDILPIGKEIPIRVFYPLKDSDTINPKTYPLVRNDMIVKKNEITLFSKPLFVHDVSRRFLEIVSSHMEIAIVAIPKNERDILPWSLEIIDPQELENRYVASFLTNGQNNHSLKHRELLLRKRFQSYAQRLSLYITPDRKLQLEAILRNDTVEVLGSE